MLCHSYRSQERTVFTTRTSLKTQDIVFFIKKQLEKLYYESIMMIHNNISMPFKNTYLQFKLFEFKPLISKQNPTEKKCEYY